MSSERICPECRVGAHDHCACECDVCAHRYDHILLAKLTEVEETLKRIVGAPWNTDWPRTLAEEVLAKIGKVPPHAGQDMPLVLRAERAEARLVKAMAALKEMRTTYKENRHAREWARFLETALECCGLCGQEIDPRFRHECPAHYVDLSSGVTYGGKAK